MHYYRSLSVMCSCLQARSTLTFSLPGTAPASGASLHWASRLWQPSAVGPSAWPPTPGGPCPCHSCFSQVRQPEALTAGAMPGHVGDMRRCRVPHRVPFHVGAGCCGLSRATAASLATASGPASTVAPARPSTASGEHLSRLLKCLASPCACTPARCMSFSRALTLEADPQSGRQSAHLIIMLRHAGRW